MPKAISTKAQAAAITTNGEPYSEPSPHGLPEPHRREKAEKKAPRRGRGARDHPATRARAIELGINNVMLGKEDKFEAFITWSNIAKVDPRNCGHMGDDYPDLELFDAVGFAASVPNAIEKVKEKADYVTKTTGGNGAAREVADLILTLKGNRDS